MAEKPFDRCGVRCSFNPSAVNSALASAAKMSRALRPWFEGPRGEIWRRIGCEQTQTADCPEVLSGWFMWILREAILTWFGP